MDKERERISREMHDDIGAGLTQITMMSESARNKGTGNTGKELDDIANTSRKLVSNMSEIIWSLNPDNKTLGQLTAYLRETLNKQLEYAKQTFSIDITEEGGDILLSKEQSRNLFLVIKEVVNNAIKHSESSSIEIKMFLGDGKLHFQVIDTGKGFDIKTTSSGNGLKNIIHRIESLGGEVEINSSAGKGSCIVYWVPIKTTT